MLQHSAGIGAKFASFFRITTKITGYSTHKDELPAFIFVNVGIFMSDGLVLKYKFRVVGL